MTDESKAAKRKNIDAIADGLSDAGREMAAFLIWDGRFDCLTSAQIRSIVERIEKLTYDC